MVHYARGAFNLLAAVAGLIAFLGMLLFPFMSAAQTAAPAEQEYRAVFSTSVSRVPITAVVRDGKSRLVRDLAREDFLVLENSQPRPILDFSATERGAITLGLLVDTSGSMRGTNLDLGKEVVDRLLKSLDRGKDEAALFTFDKAVRQETPFSNEPDRIRTALNTTDAWGLTSLYDAIADAARHVGKQQSGRRALIVVTDGDDTSSQLTPGEVSAMASAIDVPVYVLAVTPPRNGEGSADRPSDAGLSDLAYWTGGDLQYATSPALADRVIGALLDELRQQYFLAIESSGVSGWYRLDVTTRRRDFKVRARSGYFSSQSDQR